jgi:hypothetical protein
MLLVSRKFKTYVSPGELRLFLEESSLLLGEGTFFPEEFGPFHKKIYYSLKKLPFSLWEFFTTCASCFLGYLICSLKLFLLLKNFIFLHGEFILFPKAISWD